MRQLREFVDIAFDAADEPFQLRKYLVDVRRNLGHRTRKNIEIVVAVHFKFAEFGPERRVACSRAREHLRRRLGIPRCLGGAIVADAVKLVLFLEFGNFALQPLFRKAQRIDELFEFSDASDHARAVDD